MPKVEDVKVLNIDGVPYAVDGMSEQVQQLVSVYNEWNQDEADCRNRLMQLQAAKNDLSRQIILQVRNEKAEAERAEAEAGAEPAAETPPEGEAEPAAE